jgi:hypothetical protein
MRSFVQAKNPDLRLLSCAAISSVIAYAVLLAPARAEGDGLRISQDYQRKQIDCAFRWRDRERGPGTKMIGCIGFDKAMPDAAQAAMAAGKYPM